MYLSKIELTNYRNYSKLKVKLDPNINIFIGNNAQGKTNILESIYVLALTKSHRYGVENNLIRKEMLACRIKGTIKEEKKIKDLQFVLTNKSEKKVMVNDKEVKKISDYIFNMKVIMFCPDDLEMIKGSPANRRNVFNVEISQFSKEYIQCYNEYNKLLKTRNEYLKQLQSISKDDMYFEILTSSLVDRAVFIYQARNDFLNYINQNIGDIFYHITMKKGLRVEYQPNIPLNSFDAQEIKKVLTKKLQDNYQREVLQGTTLYGPHRDDFAFFLDNNDLKIFGSQGQSRLAVITFKLSEIALFQEKTKTTPILLLDDIFSEIDRKKKNRLLRYIQNGIQTIITTTDLKDINARIIKDAKIFDVAGGIVTERVKSDE